MYVCTYVGMYVYMYLQYVCAVCMYSMYVQYVCTVCMYSMYVQYGCTVCMSKYHFNLHWSELVISIELD